MFTAPENPDNKRMRSARRSTKTDLTRSSSDDRIGIPAGRFWGWFTTAAPALARNVEDTRIIDEVDRRVRELDPRLSWEIGPGRHAAWQLVISPNLDSDLLPLTRAIVAEAPAIAGWEIHPARLEKDWDFRVALDAESEKPTEVDASEWEFVLLRYPDGQREVLLRGENVAALHGDERSLAAAITLESLVGEEYLLEHIDSYELSEALEPRFAARARPIQELRAALGFRS